MLFDITEELLHKLQVVQNNAARLVMRIRKRDHITPILQDLHWLPIRARIEFKVLTLVHKCLNGSAPAYLSELLKLYSPARSLRSETKDLLIEPRFKNSKFGGRAFSVNAPRLWNTLNSDIRNNTYPTFRRQIKTELFRKYY